MESIYGNYTLNLWMKSINYYLSIETLSLQKQESFMTTTHIHDYQESWWRAQEKVGQLQVHYSSHQLREPAGQRRCRELQGDAPSHLLSKYPTGISPSSWKHVEERVLENVFCPIATNIVGTCGTKNRRVRLKSQPYH